MASARSGDRVSRWLAYGFGLGMVALVAAPGFGDPDDDSYPLSTYPMFARPRGKPMLSFVEGLDTRGEPLRLPPEVIAHDEVMQAAATVRNAVRAGMPAISELCARVAADVASDPDYAQLTGVRVVSARFDPLRYFSEGPVPEERIEHHRCAVSR